MLFKWQKRGIDKQICQLRLCAVVWQTVFEDATCFWNCHFAHTHIHNVCIWELLSLIVFVFIFIVMHNGLSCQCVSVVAAGGAIFGEAVRRHKPAPCNQLYFYFLYFVFVCWFFCIVYSFDVQLGKKVLNIESVLLKEGQVIIIWLLWVLFNLLTLTRCLPFLL